MARMRDEQIPKQILFGNLCGSSDHDRGPGRPHKSWQDCVREDLTTLRMQHNWNEIAQDRERWRSNLHKLEDPSAYLAYSSYGLESVK